MRNVRAILINPFDRTVTEVEHDADDYRNIYALLSVPEHKVGTFDAVYPFANGDTVFVDDEGLFQAETTAFYRIRSDGRGWTTPLAGCGLVLGSDEEGNTVGTAMTVEAVADAIEFLGDVHAVRARLHELA